MKKLLRQSFVSEQVCDAKAAKTSKVALKSSKNSASLAYPVYAKLSNRLQMSLQCMR